MIAQTRKNENPENRIFQIIQGKNGNHGKTLQLSDNRGWQIVQSASGKLNETRFIVNNDQTRKISKKFEKRC